MKSTCEYTIDTPTLACGFCKLDSKDDEFAYACGKSISILSAKHPFEVKSSLAGHTRTIWCLKKLPNGDLVSGSADRTIKIWSKNCEN
jgi:WD40 repeat protein